MKRLQCETEAKEYYREKLRLFGNGPQGADWSSRSAQIDRFEALTSGIGRYEGIIDFGCGVGALYEYLMAEGYSGNYCGFDLLDEAVTIASNTYGSHFTNSASRLERADHVIASGLFNVKNSASNSDWEDYIEGILNQMTSLASISIRFNLLPPNPTVKNPRGDLYFADLNWLCDVSRRLSWRSMTLQRHKKVFDLTIFVEV